MRWDARQRRYLVLRGGCAIAFVLSAAVLPRGVPAALLCVAAGIGAVVSCLWTNVGSAGERVAALPQERYFSQVRAPQGQWPPYDPAVADAPARDAGLAPER